MKQPLQWTHAERPLVWGDVLCDWNLFTSSDSHTPEEGGAWIWLARTAPKADSSSWPRDAARGASPDSSEEPTTHTVAATGLSCPTSRASSRPTTGRRSYSTIVATVEPTRLIGDR